MVLNTYIVKFTEAGTKRQKSVFTASEEDALAEVMEYRNMLNITDIKVVYSDYIKEIKEGYGNPKFYK